MMPAADSASLRALTSWRCQKSGAPGCQAHAARKQYGWWDGMPVKGGTRHAEAPVFFEERPLPITLLHFHISLHTAERQAPARCSIFSYLNFDLLFACHCAWRTEVGYEVVGRGRDFNQHQHRCWDRYGGGGGCLFIVLLSERAKRDLTLFNSHSMFASEAQWLAAHQRQSTNCN